MACRDGDCQRPCGKRIELGRDRSGRGKVGCPRAGCGSPDGWRRRSHGLHHETLLVLAADLGASWLCSCLPARTHVEVLLSMAH